MRESTTYAGPAPQLGLSLITGVVDGRRQTGPGVRTTVQSGFGDSTYSYVARGSVITQDYALSGDTLRIDARAMAHGRHAAARLKRRASTSTARDN